MRWLIAIWLGAVCLVPAATWAQSDTTVRIIGHIVSENGASVFANLFVVNKRTRIGNFANPSGDFEIMVRKSDTILIGSNGYQTQKFSVADSAYRSTYRVNIVLKPLRVQLQEAQVFAPRDLRQIYDDIERLGYDRKDYVLTGVDALQSPITALYIAFSRREQRKIEAVRIINEDRRRELLKELFAKYVAYNIIDLKNEEFDDFVDFCNVSDAMLKKSTQYEFIEFIKVKYALYEELTRYDDYKRTD